MIVPLAVLLPAVAGLFAGYGAWLSHHGGVFFGFGDQFLRTLLTVGAFGALLLGLGQLLTVLVQEQRPMKAAGHFLLALGVGLAVPMTAGVIFSILREWLSFDGRMQPLMQRFLWWATLAAALGVARGVLHGNPHAGAVGFVGLAPALVVGGLLLDAVLVPAGHLLLAGLLLGLLAGTAVGLASEMLKWSWLEEHQGGAWRRRYLLEGESFAVGPGDENDLSLPAGYEHAFEIQEREGMHLLVVAADGPLVVVNGALVRHRSLVDGDAITAGGVTYIYHNRFALVRDALPAAHPAGLPGT